MAMTLDTVLLGLAVLATLVSSYWTIRLRMAGNPAWKLAGATALLCLAGGTSYLEGNERTWVSVSLLLTVIALYFLRRYGPEVEDLDEDQDAS